MHEYWEWIVGRIPVKAEVLLLILVAANDNWEIISTCLYVNKEAIMQ